MGVLGSNRQLLALAICIYAIRFVVEKKPVIFFLLVLLATTFHNTAFLFAIYYFINKSIKPKVLVSVLLFAFIIGKTQLPVFVFSRIGDLFGGQILYRTVVYADSAKDSLADAKLSIIGLMKRLVFLFFFYYNRKQLREKLVYYNTLLNGYYIGIVIYFLFSNTLIILVARGSLYFNIMEPLLLASQLYILNGKELKLISIVLLLVFSIFFFFQSIAPYPDLFIPYKGVLINTNFHRNLY